MTSIGVTLGTRGTRGYLVLRHGKSLAQTLILATHVLCFGGGGDSGVSRIQYQERSKSPKKEYSERVSLHPSPFRTCTLLQTRARMALAEHEWARARARVRVQSSDLLENKEAPGNAPFGSGVAPTSKSQKSAVCWPYIENILGHSLLRI